MNRSKLRRQIAWEAARLMYTRQESEYYRAKMKAARRICQGWVKPADLPSQRRDPRPDSDRWPGCTKARARIDNLRDMRLAALAMMQRLAPFRPRLIGSVLTGHIRARLRHRPARVLRHGRGGHACARSARTLYTRSSGSRSASTAKSGSSRTSISSTASPFELTVYAADKAHYVFKSSITGKAIERASIAELEQFLAHEYPDLDIAAALADNAAQVDRFQLYESLLLPLENVKQPLKYHPEGDALYHSLQVFDLARDELAVRRGVSAGGAAARRRQGDRSGGSRRGRPGSPRRLHHRAHGVAHRAPHAGPPTGRRHARRRARRRLAESEHFDDLVLLGECDRAGRSPGVEAPELEEALDYLRELDTMFG